MKKAIIAILSLVALNSCCPVKDGSTTTPIDQSKDKTDPLNFDQVVTTIQKQYECAIKKLAEEEKIKDIEITSAELSLTVTKATSGNGELSIPVFVGSGSIEKSNSTAVTFTLSKEDASGGSVNASETDDNKLCDLIVSAAKKFHNLKHSIGDLKKDSFDLDIVFSLEKKAGGKITFKIWGIGGELGAERTSTVEHEMKLTFKPVKP